MFLDPLGFVLKEYRRLGPLFRVRALHHVFTALVRTDANAFAARTPARHLSAASVWGDFGSEFGATVFLPGSDGPPHYRLRRIEQLAYSRSAIASRIPEAIAIGERWLRQYPAGASVPLVKLMQRIVTEQLGVLLTGRGPGDALDDIATTVRFSLNCTLIHKWPGMLMRLPLYFKRVVGRGSTAWPGRTRKVAG